MFYNFHLPKLYFGLNVYHFKISLFFLGGGGGGNIKLSLFYLVSSISLYSSFISLITLNFKHLSFKSNVFYTFTDTSCTNCMRETLLFVFIQMSCI